jgi:hypothetical protein
MSSTLRSVRARSWVETRTSRPAFQDQQLGAGKDREAQTQALAHTAGVPAHRASARVAEAHLLENSVDPRPAYAACSREEAEQLVAGEIVRERDGFRQVPDAPLPGVVDGDRGAVDEEGARVGSHQAEQHLHEGRLAGPVRAGEHGDASPFEAETHLDERLNPPQANRDIPGAERLYGDTSASSGAWSTTVGV